MKVYPPLMACLLYAAKMFGLIYVLLFGIAIITHALQHQPLFASFRSDFWVLPPFLIGIPVVLALVVYLGARVWAWSFDQYGVKGRSYWGRQVAIRWADVGSVASTSVQGIPALVICSRSAKAKLFAYTLGVDLRQIYTQLNRRAGPEHVLTQCFRPRAA